MTPEDVARRLVTDLPFYSEKMLVIKPKVGELVPMRYNKAQLYLHSRMEDMKRRKGYVRVLVLKGRQQGVSTYLGSRGFKNTVTLPGVNAYVFAHDMDTSESLYAMVQRFYDNLPPAFRPKADTKNAKEMKFKGLSSGYKVGTGGSRGIGRGQTLQFIHWSEVAYTRNPDEHAGGILQALPLEPGTEAAFESTANGQGDYFHLSCMAALNGSGDFELVFIPWYWQDDYKMPLPNGKVPVLDDDEIAYLDTYAKDGLTVQHLMWRRFKVTEMKGDVYRFKREYPFSPQEAFEASDDNSFIKALLVRKAIDRAPIVTNAPKIWGVDPARLGGDAFKIAERIGRNFTKLEELKPARTDQTAEILGRMITEKKPWRVNIDVGGLGVGVYDNLIRLGHGEVVRAVNFGESSLYPDRFKNKRCEMYGGAKEWLEDAGGASMAMLPMELQQRVMMQLCALQYDYVNNVELRLEAKEQLKKRLKFSPDDADSFVLTFATSPTDSAQNTTMGQTFVASSNWNPYR